MLQEFPNGCGRAKNADCIEDIRTAITCFTLWLNLQMEPFANCHDHASYQYLTPVILWFTTFGIQDLCCQTTSCFLVCNQRLPYTCECKNILLDLRRYCCRHFTESPFDGEEPMTPESPTSSKPLLPEVWSLKSWSCWSWSYLKNCGRFLFLPYLLGQRSTTNIFKWSQEREWFSEPFRLGCSTKPWPHGLESIAL